MFIAAVELLLQLAALFSKSRISPLRPEATVRVLCVGDSHTYGAGVPEDEAYPAQLQAQLDAEQPEKYSVINLGIPGMSSTQVRRRLAANVLRYEPDLVILWAGSNDTWNHSELERNGTPWGSVMDGLASRSRGYRMLRVWIHDRALERAVDAGVRSDGVRQAVQLENWKPNSDELGATWTMRHGGVVETIVTQGDARQPRMLAEERVYREQREMVGWLRAAGIPAVLVQYPLEAGSFGEANHATKRVAAEFDVRVVAAAEALSRVPKKELRWLSGAHPNGPVDRELARDLLPVVLELTDRG